ncbi:N-acetyltransferase domain-containing protein [Fusarium falciforme]|uniref:N-acetyltransferase domain-containing protein n=1 Tax=Fusarium falciforme TaxID=195108 RepID=UPI00230021FD|nr:N-acetyltransferase domain-containing protein [Fusarium falciforme]WAO91662.1 N-acetyltransferase domain-containing protein [Fusarium falciforme]
MATPTKLIQSLSGRALGSATTNGSAALGPIVPDVQAQQPSRNITLAGKYASIVPISRAHADDLWESLQAPDSASLFDYLFDEPYDSLDALNSAIAKKAAASETWTYAILRKSSSGPSKAVGMASLMRMDLPNRVIEVGSILYSPTLQRTPCATEAMYLLASYVFETLGFRRYEWKCNDLNAPSRRAAVRLGFTYEGTFRQHMIAKGRNRDTAWYSMLDWEWSATRRGFKQWLDPSNFDAEGKQKRKLEACMVEVSTKYDD